MKYLILILSVFLILFGCTSPPDDNGEDDLSGYTDLLVKATPAECKGMESCELFACATYNCWCDEGRLDGGVVAEYAIRVPSMTRVDELVKRYFSENPNEAGTIRSIKKISDLYYNVFYEVNDSERVLTVMVDGTILATQCGV
ncbi:MAG: hypothetical protein ABII22_05690 [Candidatus Micrarchaeota archaeon]